MFLVRNAKFIFWKLFGKHPEASDDNYKRHIFITLQGSHVSREECEVYFVDIVH